MNRRQATLFLTGVPLIDRIRSRFDPIQSGLIASHVTLIREDEVEDWDVLADRARTIEIPEVTLRFGTPALEDGLLYLPCIGSTAPFDGLRKVLLNSPTVRKHSPHVTLIHPRNGRCTDASFKEIAGLVEPFEHTFQNVAFIEQRNGGAWQKIVTFPLLTALA